METLRAKGRTATPLRYARVAVTSYFRLDRGHPRLTVEVPGSEPVDGVHLAFVSNTDPWTYLDARAMHLNPGCSFDGGLGLFALRTLRMPTVLRHVGQVFLNREPRGENLVRLDDVGTIKVTCVDPVRLQVDGDHLGERTAVEFSSASAALRVAV
nr:hypothetical protein GCM10020241_45310 [Streptoalloteichus tenebrarius]